MKYNVPKAGVYQVQSKNFAYESELSNKAYILAMSSDIFKIKELFENPSSIGLFKYMSEKNDEWGNFIKEHFEIPASDVEYVYNISGEKYISPLVVRFIRDSYGTKDAGYPINIKWLDMLSNLLKQRFYVKWEKLYNSLNFTYDPLKPYDMTISESNQLESNDISTDTTTSESTTNSTSEGSRQGFNSLDYQPVDKHTMNDNDESSSTKNRNSTRNESNDRKISRQGNIGNITLQELIEKERNVYDWQFMNVVYKDLDSILTINFYGGII